MNRLFDLRFVIGSFFSVVGVLLLIHGLAAKDQTMESVNRWCGIVFTLFGVIMILLSFRVSAHDAHDELS